MYPECTFRLWFHSPGSTFPLYVRKSSDRVWWQLRHRTRNQRAFISTGNQDTRNFNPTWICATGINNVLKTEVSAYNKTGRVSQSPTVVETLKIYLRVSPLRTIDYSETLTTAVPTTKFAFNCFFTRLHDTSSRGMYILRLKLHFSYFWNKIIWFSRLLKGEIYEAVVQKITRLFVSAALGPKVIKSSLCGLISGSFCHLQKYWSCRTKTT